VGGVIIHEGRITKYLVGVKWIPRLLN